MVCVPLAQDATASSGTSLAMEFMSEEAEGHGINHQDQNIFTLATQQLGDAAMLKPGWWSSFTSHVLYLCPMLFSSSCGWQAGS